MLNEKKVVPKLRQEVKVKVDIVTSDDIKIYYTGKFQDFTARYIINLVSVYVSSLPVAHISDASRRRLVVTGDSARAKLGRAPPDSLTCSVYSNVTRDFGLKFHPKDKILQQ